jgi:hypothetical protein
VIACDEYHSSTALGVAQHTTNHIGMALFPTPFVLLNLPGVDYVTYKIQCVTTIMLEEIIKMFRLAVFCTQVDITHKNTSVSFLH